MFEKSDFGSRPGNSALKKLLESDSGGSSCLWSGFLCFHRAWLVAGIFQMVEIS